MTAGASRAEVGRPVQSGDFLCLALVAGIITGVVEVAILYSRERLRGGQLLFAGSDMVWMTPLADGLLFAAVVGGLLLAGRVFRPASSRPIVLGVLGFLVFLTPVLLHRGLHPLAQFLLAGGLAIQVSRVLAPRLDRITPGVRRVALVLWLLILGVAFGMRVERVVRERRLLERLPASSPDRPNVLLLILDTVRASEFSLYGYPRPTTPEIDRRAASALKFRRALSTAPWTLPSHASMFTGRWPHELSADWLIPLDDHFPTLAEELARLGYQTAGFVGNTTYCSAETGLARGFAHYEDYEASGAELLNSPGILRAVTQAPGVRQRLGFRNLIGRKDAGDINRSILDWLDQRDAARPFFGFLNFFDAHEPYIPPAEFASRFTPPGTTLRSAFRRHSGRDQPWSKEEIDGAMNAYDASIAYLDSEIGRLFAELEKRGLLSNTIVILTSDHGEEFAEHGLIMHGNSLYRAALDVPLIIWLPNATGPGQWIDTPVSLRDIPATVIDLVGDDGPSLFPGRSLARHWDGSVGASVADTLVAEVRRAPHLPAWYPVSGGDMYSVALGGLRYIRGGKGSEELYDFDHDVAEMTDMASGQYQEKLELMRSTLAAVVGAMLKPAP